MLRHIAALAIALAVSVPAMTLADEVNVLSNVALKAIIKSKYARQNLPVACVLLVDFRIEGKWGVGELREKHDEKCGGDPRNAPRLTTVSVNRRTKRVYFENLDGERVPAKRYRGPL